MIRTELGKCQLQQFTSDRVFLGSCSVWCRCVDSCRCQAAHLAAPSQLIQSRQSHMFRFRAPKCSSTSNRDGRSLVLCLLCHESRYADAPNRWLSTCKSRPFRGVTTVIDANDHTMSRADRNLSAPIVPYSNCMNECRMSWNRVYFRGNKMKLLCKFRFHASTILRRDLKTVSPPPPVLAKCHDKRHRICLGQCSSTMSPVWLA